MTAALELQGITKSYDTVQVLQKINLTVEEGAVSYTHLTLPTILRV